MIIRKKSEHNNLHFIWFANQYYDFIYFTAFWCNNSMWFQLQTWYLKIIFFLIFVIHRKLALIRSTLSFYIDFRITITESSFPLLIHSIKSTSNWIGNKEYFDCIEFFVWQLFDHNLKIVVMPRSYSSINSIIIISRLGCVTCN